MYFYQSVWLLYRHLPTLTELNDSHELKYELTA